MGNCMDTSSDHSHHDCKPETPRLQILSVKEEEEATSRLPTNPREVEDRRGVSAANPPIAFTFDEVKIITDNFKPKHVLGEGGFGSVYKGFIPKNLRARIQPMEVAVKVHAGDRSSQGHSEWQAEVIILGQLSHSNLVKLVGYCCEDDHQVLVYEYMAQGSTENHLFSRALDPLPWAIRMKIAYHAAQGLAFLHESKQPVIYRDFKTSNILLDADYNAKLSDFGLAKDGPVGDSSHVSTRVMGTYGYAAPEYLNTGHLSASSDVYSFGVVLLELITGRKSLDRSQPPAKRNLLDWAFPLLHQKKNLISIVDPRLEQNYPARSVRKAAMLAYYCLNQNPKARPLMRDVVDTLHRLQYPADIPDNFSY